MSEERVERLLDLTLSAMAYGILAGADEVGEGRDSISNSRLFEMIHEYAQKSYTVQAMPPGRVEWIGHKAVEDARLEINGELGGVR